MSGNDYSAGPTSLTLLARVKANDPEAWVRLSKIYGPLVYGWAQRYRLSADDAADIMQETFLILIRKLESFQRDRPGDSFRGWLWTVARNQIRDHVRRLIKVAADTGGTTHRLLLQEIAADEPEPSEEDGERQEARNRALKEILDVVRGDFTPKAWQAFSMLTTQNRTAADVAAELGLSKSAVHQAKYRILKRIREELDHFGLSSDEQ